MGLVILAVLLVIVFFLFKVVIKSTENTGSQTPNRAPQRPTSYQSNQPAASYTTTPTKPARSVKEFIDPDDIESEDFKGLLRISIAGLSYRGITSKDVGYFEGVITPEPDNKYDEHAIAIYKGRKLVGYVPRRENKLLAQLGDIDGLSVFGYIIPQYDEEDLSDDDDQYYTGEIFIAISASPEQVERHKKKLKSLV